MYLRVLRQWAVFRGEQNAPPHAHGLSPVSVFPSTPGLGRILTNSLGSPGTSPCCMSFLTSTHYQCRVKCPRF